MSRKIYNVVKPREGQNGKTHWDRHGVLIADGEKISLHIDSIPTGEWNGWFNVYPREEPDAQQVSHGGNGQYHRNNGSGGNGQMPPSNGFDDDIPF